MNDSTVSAPVAKVISAWITVWTATGITSWAQAASAVATIYTLILIGEWFWKKFRQKK
jgi:hypothetical protein